MKTEKRKDVERKDAQKGEVKLEEERTGRGGLDKRKGKRERVFMKQSQSTQLFL